MTRHSSRDANHPEIVAALEGIGCYVVDCAEFGRGFPDLLVLHRGRWVPVEVKDGAKPPSARKLRPSQRIFHAEVKSRGGPIHTVTSVAEALAVFGARVSA